LSAGTSPGAFSADEQEFFRHGEAMESGELAVEELMDRQPRPSRSWRLVLIGAAAGAAVLVLSLAGGQQKSGDAIAAVRAAPPVSAPAVLPPDPAPAPAAEAPIAAPAQPIADEIRPSKAKKIKHAHRSARGKRR
jgi:hypothetical protein